MPDQDKDNLLEEIAQMLSQQGSAGLRPVLELLFNAVMGLEREEALRASPYQRSEERRGHANGYKPKTLNTRMGKLKLKVPQARGMSFYPGCLEKGCRSERALKLAIAEMYLKGVSTRKVQAITEELCGLEFSSTQVSRFSQELDEELDKFRHRPLGEMSYLFLDATYLKVRHNGTVIDTACLVAYGVNTEGRREIVGVSMALSEAEVHWRDFLAKLQQRGLCGVKLITSDDHAGLRQARQSMFPSIPWQRCQFHLSQNAQSYAPRKSLRSDIAQAMRDIFQAPDRSTTDLMINRVRERFKRSAPEFVNWLDDNIEEGLTVHAFPRAHQQRLRTTNGLERVNREIKRRTRVAVMFPNMESALRLVTGVLVEIHEDWVTGKQYLDLDKPDCLAQEKERQVA